MTEREAFEAWIDKYSRLDKTYPMTLQGIRDAGRELSWNAWQASRKQMAEEAIGAVLMTPSQFVEQGRFADAIRSLTPTPSKGQP